jgi:superfamily II DNA or RNA helicase
MSLRPWQQEFVRHCRALSPTNKRIIVHAVPAAGKGSVPYLLYAHAPRSMVDAVCHVVPRLNLRAQSETVPGFLVDHFGATGMRQPIIRAADNQVPFRRGADGYAICWDSIGEAPSLHLQEFRLARYALIIDEPQMLGEGVAKALAPLVEHASCLSMMSGTFSRGDRKRIPFLPYKNTPTGEMIDYGADGWMTVNYTRREALRDRAILPIEFIRRDARAKFVKGGSVRHFDSFSELETEEDQRAGLYAVLSEQGGWQIAQEMVAAWARHRQSVPSAQALIITHSQQQAREYRQRLQVEHPGVTIRIAISDEPGSQAALNRFRTSKGEILITVGMAYVGFDAPRISHIALLTYVRQRAWIEQAISRGARIAPDAAYGMQRCLVFTPDDPLLLTIIRAIEADQVEALTEAKEEGIGEREVAPRERQETTVIDVNLTHTRAHELNVVELTHDLSERLLHAATEDGISGTPSQLLHTFNKAFGLDPLVFAATPPLIGVREQETILRNKIEHRCRAIDGQRAIPFGATNGDILRQFRKPRGQMSVPELAQVLAWLDQTYPLAA